MDNSDKEYHVHFAFKTATELEEKLDVKRQRWHPEGSCLEGDSFLTGLALYSNATQP
jgi:hypothetical protein